MVNIHCKIQNSVTLHNFQMAYITYMFWKLKYKKKKLKKELKKEKTVSSLFLPHEFFLATSLLLHSSSSSCLGKSSSHRPSTCHNLMTSSEFPTTSYPYHMSCNSKPNKYEKKIIWKKKERHTRVVCCNSHTYHHFNKRIIVIYINQHTY